MGARAEDAPDACAPDWPTSCDAPGAPARRTPTCDAPKTQHTGTQSSSHADASAAPRCGANSWTPSVVPDPHRGLCDARVGRTVAVLPVLSRPDASIGLYDRVHGGNPPLCMAEGAPQLALASNVSEMDANHERQHAPSTSQRGVRRLCLARCDPTKGGDHALCGSQGQRGRPSPLHRC